MSIHQHPDPDAERVHATFEGGRRRWVMVIHRNGPNRGQTAAEVARLHRSHYQHLARLRAAGKLRMYTTAVGDDPVRSISVYDSADPDEVRAIQEADANIASGRLTFSVHLVKETDLAELQALAALPIPKD